MTVKLNRAGLSVYADDHRGDGQTGLLQIEKTKPKHLEVLVRAAWMQH